MTSFDRICEEAKKPFKRAFLRRFQKGEKSQPCAIMPHASQAKLLPAANVFCQKALRGIKSAQKGIEQDAEGKYSNERKNRRGRGF